MAMFKITAIKKDILGNVTNVDLGTVEGAYNAEVIADTYKEYHGYFATVKIEKVEA